LRSIELAQGPVLLAVPIGPEVLVLVIVLFVGFACSITLAVAGAADSRVPVRSGPGVREPRATSLLGRALAWLAAGVNLGVAALLSPHDVLASLCTTAFIALPAWTALRWVVLLPRRRRVRNLLFTISPLPFLALGWPHPSLRGYVTVAVWFSPTLVAVLVAILAPVSDSLGGEAGPPRESAA